LEKSQIIPHEVRSILMEQYHAQQARGQDNSSESPHEYASRQVESTMQGGANYAGSAAQRGIDKMRRDIHRIKSAGTEDQYKQKASDNNARPEKAGQSFSDGKTQSAQMPEHTKKSLQIQRAKNSQLEKQNFRNAGTHVEKSTTQRFAMSSARSAGVKAGRTAKKKAAHAVKKKVERQVQKQVAKETVRRSVQAAKATARLTIKVAKAVVKATISLIKGLIALGGVGVAIAVILIIIIAAVLMASPFGIFYSGNDNTPDVTTVSDVVQELNKEFTAKIDDIKAANTNVDSIKFDYTGIANSTQVENWPDVIAIFAVETNMNADNATDVATMDTANVEKLKDVFWDMNQIDSHVETIEHTSTQTVVNYDGTTSEVTTTTDEHILHITITGKSAEGMASEYNFTADQKSVMEEMLSSDIREQINALLGISNS
jgi:hypothetical protein